MSARNEYQVFKLGKGASTKIGIILVLGLAGLIKVLPNAIFLIKTPGLLIALVQLLLVSVASIVCFPLLRDFYSCAVEKDRVCGVNTPMPLWNSKASCDWKRVAHVEHHRDYLISFYKLCDSKRRPLLYIPCDLENFERFKALVVSHVGRDHPFSEVLLMEKRNKSKGFITLSNTKEYFLVRGRVALADGSPPTYPVKVSLSRASKHIDQVITSPKGTFHFEISSFPGEHEVKLETPESLKGRAAFKLPRNYKEEIVIYAKKGSVKIA